MDVNGLTEQGRARRFRRSRRRPIQSRFLFVDVAALRAKQLRRGARRAFDGATDVPVPHKAERVAMEEVRRGLVYYDVPDAEAKAARPEGEG